MFAEFRGGAVRPPSKYAPEYIILASVSPIIAVAAAKKRRRRNHSCCVRDFMLFINIHEVLTFTETSIDEANKTQQKVRCSKFMLRMSSIHANTCIQTTTPLRNRCRNDGVVQQPPLPQQTFLQLLHIMDPRTVDPVLKDTSDAILHRI